MVVGFAATSGNDSHLQKSLRLFTEVAATESKITEVAATALKLGSFFLTLFSMSCLNDKRYCSSSRNPFCEKSQPLLEMTQAVENTIR